MERQVLSAALVLDSQEVPLGVEEAKNLYACCVSVAAAGVAGEPVGIIPGVDQLPRESSVKIL
jgi:hypothetical protein